MWNEWKWINMLWAVNVIALGLNVFNDVGGCLTDFFFFFLSDLQYITSAALKGTVVKGQEVYLIQSPLKSGHSLAIMFMFLYMYIIIYIYALWCLWGNQTWAGLTNILYESNHFVLYRMQWYPYHSDFLTSNVTLNLNVYIQHICPC